MPNGLFDTFEAGYFLKDAPLVSKSKKIKKKKEIEDKTPLVPPIPEEKDIEETFPTRTSDIKTDQMLRASDFIQKRREERNLLSYQSAVLDPYDYDSFYDQPEKVEFPEEDLQEKESHPTRSVVNFLFSDELGLLGMKWDQDGFNWAFDNVKHQLIEHPYSTAFTIASYLFPIGFAWRKGARVAARAGEALGVKAGEQLGKGLLGSTLGFKFDDHAKIIRKLAFGAESEGKRFFSPELVEKLKGMADDEIAKLIPERELKKMLMADYHMEKFFALRNTIKETGGTASQRAQLWLQQKFANKYFARLTEQSREAIESLDDFYRKAQFGTMLAAAPAAETGEAIYKFLIGRKTYDNLVSEIGDEGALWADSLRNHWSDLYQQQLAEGFMDEASDMARFFTEELGGFHVPALLKGTPGAVDVGVKAKTLITSKAGKVLSKEAVEFGKAMGGPTMLQRGKFITTEAIEEALPKLITDPTEVTIAGYIKDAQIFHIYKVFRDLIMDGMKPGSRYSNYVMDFDKYEKLPDKAKSLWVNFEELNSVVPGVAERMSRMIGKAMAPAKISGALPVIDRQLAEEFFGPSGAMNAAFQSGGWLELLTAVHKTSRTALNIPTHMSNLVGNMTFLAMAGMNPFSRAALNDGKTLTSAFAKLAKQFHDARGSIGFDDLMLKDNLAKAFGKERFITDRLGNKIDLADMFADDLMKELVEAQAFENVEGFNYLKKLLTRIDAAEAGAGWRMAFGKGSTALKGTAAAIAGIGEIRGIRGTLQNLSAAYLAEDMIPKMMYAMNLARKGWGRDAIIKEVGRRLPQYKTVGQLPSKLRRVVLPWITFPSEALRIMKNNMFDHPVRTAIWMQAPMLFQSVASSVGFGANLDEVDKWRAMLPTHADRYQTVMIKGETAPEVLGVAGGAGWGALGGAALGGARGAALGGVAGAAIGYGVGARFGHDVIDESRGWVLDFLPQSTIMTNTLSPLVFEQLLHGPGATARRAAIDLAPVEPYAVLMPLMDVYTGRGAFGSEIRSVSGKEGIEKMALGLLGALSPPFIQKYGMKLQAPETGTLEPMAQIFDVNGGQMTLPGWVEPTFYGLLASSLSALGASKLGFTGKSLLLPAAIAGTLGTLAGGEVNTRRLLTDLGLERDPYTGVRGNWTMDFIGNSILGINKSWRATPEQQIADANRRADMFQEIRSVQTRRFQDAILRGDKDRAMSELPAMYKAFLAEFGNSSMARQKFGEKLEQMINELVRLPQLRQMSNELLQMRINIMKDMLQETGDQTDRLLLDTLITEQYMRQLNKARNVKIIDKRTGVNKYTRKRLIK